ncbi:hypothetical protein Aca07nite_45190 [Actinoplanes capillaceus]|uniref:Helix-turn-helix domain-containing protein n=1 Tax=Actinoplanes campanulatus TaxID=113559 RepID=A0ABQ3WLX3_9ACTN|nr:hypothetical protein Aca07nite_45190 [Actinoplanes capillaceus]
MLTDDEREQLLAWSRRPSSAQALAARSRIVLACADTPDLPNGQIAETLGVSRLMVTKWRNRFTARSTRSMAARAGRSQTAISRIWRAFGLQPHRQDTWKLSKDPQFIAKVRDVVGLYLGGPLTTTSGPAPPASTPPSIRLDQDRRPDPRLHRPLLQPNQRLTALVLQQEIRSELL